MASARSHERYMVNSAFVRVSCHRSLLRTVVWPWGQEPRSRGITFGALVRVSREEPGYPVGAACWRSPAL